MSVSNVRVRVVRMANDDGSNQTVVSPADVQTWITVANQVFTAANLRFLFNAANFETRTSTILNAFDANRGLPQDAAADQVAQNIADELPDFVTIICRKGRPGMSTGCGPGCGASSFPGKYVLMPEFDLNNQTILAHELGHFFGLSHTFGVQEPNIQSAGATFDALRRSLAPLDGDAPAVMDTPAEILIHDQDGAMASSILLRGQSIAFLRSNIMSYYAPLTTNGKTITPGQSARINAVLKMRGLTAATASLEQRADRRRRLVGLEQLARAFRTRQ